MRKYLVVVMATVLLVSAAGCSMFKSNVSTEAQAYKAGRLAVVGYILGKDKLKPEQVQALEAAWKAFDTVAYKLGGTDASAAKDMAKAELRKNIKDDTQYMLAVEAVDTAWTELEANVDLSDLKDKEAVLVILAFHNGIKTALSDYSVK